MSAEARARIAAAQRARWAEWHKAQRKVRSARPKILLSRNEMGRD